MKRVLRGVFIVCLLLLLGAAGWTVYRRTGEVREASQRLSELSAEYGELSGSLKS